RIACGGDDVAELQSAINAAEPVPDPSLVVDGVFGPLTEAAVVAFQSANGLVPDGIVGPHTRAALTAALPPAEPRGPTPTPPSSDPAARGSPTCPPRTPGETEASRQSRGQVLGLSDQAGGRAALLFDFLPGSAVIRPVHDAFLRETTTNLGLDRLVPQARIALVEGFTDCVNTETLNTPIRAQRAEAAAAALRARGVPA